MCIRDRIGETDGAKYELPEVSGPVANRLRNELLNIQEGRAPDRFNWLYTANTSDLGQANA